MRAPLRSRSALIATSAVMLGAVLLWAAPTVAQTRVSRGFGMVEYAELEIFGNDAIFQTVDQTFFLRGPSKRTPEPTSNERGVSRTRPARLYHLSRIGESGWEISEVGSTQSRPTFLMVRKRY